MKVKKIVEAELEYSRLSGLISNIKTALADFDKQETKQGNITFTTGSVSCASFTINDPNQERIETVSVYLGSELTKLLKPKIQALLRKELVKLKKERDSLEV